MKQILSRSSDTKQSDFIWNKFIQKGAYGEVHKVTLKSTKRIFAIKKIDKLKLFAQNMDSQIANQVNIMYSIKHPNIVKIIDSFESETHLFIVLEYLQMGSLFIELKRKKKLDQPTTRKCLRDIINAVEYLHSMQPPIIHRDIKPQNILIDSHGTYKLADFGWSNFSGILRVTYCGTAPYLAPEMILKLGHDKRLDYWCLGVLTYELLCGYAPFDNGRGDTHQRAQQLQKNILDVKYKFPPGLSKEARNFIQRLLKKNPAQRMNVQQMKGHDFICGTINSIPVSMTEMRIVEEDGQSEASQIIKDDPFHALAQRFNKSQLQNRFLKEELYYMKQEVKRLKEDSIEKSMSNGSKSNHDQNQTNNQTLMIEELKTKLKLEQMQNVRLTQRVNQLTKRTELQALYQVQLQGEVQQLKNVNRQLRKLKELQMSIGDHNRLSLNSHTSKSSRSQRSQKSPQSFKKNAVQTSIDNSFKKSIIQQFLQVQTLQKSIAQMMDQSKKRQIQLINKISGSSKQDYEQRIQGIKEQFDRKSQQQFKEYTEQLRKLAQTVSPSVDPTIGS